MLTCLLKNVDAESSTGEIQVNFHVILSIVLVQTGHKVKHNHIPVRSIDLHACPQLEAQLANLIKATLCKCL